MIYEQSTISEQAVVKTSSRNRRHATQRQYKIIYYATLVEPLPDAALFDVNIRIPQLKFSYLRNKVHKHARTTYGEERRERGITRDGILYFFVRLSISGTTTRGNGKPMV